MRVLRAAGHDVLAVAESAPGAPDDKVIALAQKQRRILITEDKDFGQLVFAAAASTSGVIYVRYRCATVPRWVWICCASWMSAARR